MCMPKLLQFDEETLQARGNEIETLELERNMATLIDCIHLFELELLNTIETGAEDQLIRSIAPRIVSDAVSSARDIVMSLLLDYELHAYNQVLLVASLFLVVLEMNR